MPQTVFDYGIIKIEKIQETMNINIIKKNKVNNSYIYIKLPQRRQSGANL